MTRRQWMWLWIWLLLFFIIFCIWSKLQSMQDEIISTTAKPVVIEQETKNNEKEQVVEIDKTQTKDLTLKIVKDGDIVKLSGVFPSQQKVHRLMQTLKSVGSEVKRGTIIIDKDAHNPKLFKAIEEMSKDFANFKNGYIEYHDKKMTIDGIVNRTDIKESISQKASNIGDLEVTNLVMIEEKQTPIQQPKIVDIKPTQSKDADKIEEKQKKEMDQKTLQRKKAKQRRDRARAQAQLDRVLRSKPVEFIYAKDELTPKSKRLINQVYAVLKKYPDIRVKIAGHTDSDGTKENNLKLSQKRANAIKRYLVKKGIKAKRLVAIGYGESRPLVKNDTPAHKQINRRVEFRVIK